MQPLSDSTDLRPAPYFYGGATVLGVLFALSSSTVSPLSLPFLLLLWLGQTLLPVAMLIKSQQFWQQQAWSQRLSAWLQLTLAGLSGSVLFCVPALMIDVAIGLERWYGSPHQWCQALAKEMLGVTPVVTLAWVALNAPWVLGWRLVRPLNSNLNTVPSTEMVERMTTADVVAPNDAVMEIFTLPIFAAVPPAKRAELYYLKAELHYLQVVTANGSCLILSSLRDAIAVLEARPDMRGIQPHRSYWVRLDAVRQLRRDGRQGCLSMPDGGEIPVSRTAFKTVAALLEPRLALTLPATTSPPET